MFRIAMVLGIALGLALLVVACGDDDDNSSSSTTTKTATPTGVAAAEASVCSSLNTLNQANAAFSTVSANTTVGEVDAMYADLADARQEVVSAASESLQAQVDDLGQAIDVVQNDVNDLKQGITAEKITQTQTDAAEVSASADALSQSANCS